MIHRVAGPYHRASVPLERRGGDMGAIGGFGYPTRSCYAASADPVESGGLSRRRELWRFPGARDTEQRRLAIRREMMRNDIHGRCGAGSAPGG